MRTNENYRENTFIEAVRRMEDRDLLLAYSNRSDYNPAFIRLAEQELSLRGYTPADTDRLDTDYLIIRRKETHELVEIYTNGTDYINGWEELAKRELESRRFDISSLYAVKSGNKRFLKEGIRGRYIGLGYFFSALGGLVGLIFALNYAFAGRTTVNGERYPKYNRSTRSNGKAMLAVAAASVIVQLIVRLS